VALVEAAVSSLAAVPDLQAREDKTSIEELMIRATADAEIPRTAG
jgi:hypothetical protein